MTKAERVRDFSQYLKEEGYLPTTDEDGDIVFKAEGLHHFVCFEEQDEEYARIILPGLWTIESPEERVKAEIVANAITGAVKVAKVFVVRDNVMATVELFTSSMGNFKLVFARSMSALRTIARKFREEMYKA